MSMAGSWLGLFIVFGVSQGRLGDRNEVVIWSPRCSMSARGLPQYPPIINPDPLPPQPDFPANPKLGPCDHTNAQLSANGNWLVVPVPVLCGELDLQPFPRILSVLMHIVHQPRPAPPRYILHPCCVRRYIMSVHVPVQYQLLHGTGCSSALRCLGRVCFVPLSHLVNRQNVGHLTVTNDLELREKLLGFGRCLRPRSTHSPVQRASGSRWLRTPQKVWFWIKPVHRGDQDGYVSFR